MDSYINYVDLKTAGRTIHNGYLAGGMIKTLRIDSPKDAMILNYRFMVDI